LLVCIDDEKSQKLRRELRTVGMTWMVSLDMSLEVISRCGLTEVIEGRSCGAPFLF
jgi:hypothetical protein